MANTTLIDGNLISITLDGATDWSLITDMPNRLSTGILVHSISVNSLTGVITICRNARVAAAIGTGPIIFKFISGPSQLNYQFLFPGGVLMWPSFDDGADNGIAQVVIQFE